MLDSKHPHLLISSVMDSVGQDFLDLLGDGFLDGCIKQIDRISYDAINLRTKERVEGRSQEGRKGRHTLGDLAVAVDGVRDLAGLLVGSGVVHAVGDLVLEARGGLLLDLTGETGCDC